MTLRGPLNRTQERERERSDSGGREGGPEPNLSPLKKENRAGPTLHEMAASDNHFRAVKPLPQHGFVGILEGKPPVLAPTYKFCLWIENYPHNRHI